MGGNQSKTFAIYNNSALEIPIGFTPNLIRSLSPPPSPSSPTSVETPTEIKATPRKDSEKMDPSIKGELDTVQIFREIETLLSRYTPLSTKNSDQVSKITQGLIECYSSHPGRPLDCKRHVDSLKSLDIALTAQ